ncbi:MAG: hypothetical protein NNA22_10060 [Nitrospira sp.]|nr:hypothetical protein [Nitrospira sp.]
MPLVFFLPVFTFFFAFFTLAIVSPPHDLSFVVRDWRFSSAHAESSTLPPTAGDPDYSRIATSFSPDLPMPLMKLTSTLAPN